MDLAGNVHHSHGNETRVLHGQEDSQAVRDWIVTVECKMIVLTASGLLLLLAVFLEISPTQALLPWAVHEGVMIGCSTKRLLMLSEQGTSRNLDTMRAAHKAFSSGLELAACSIIAISELLPQLFLLCLCPLLVQLVIQCTSKHLNTTKPGNFTRFLVCGFNLVRLLTFALVGLNLSEILDIDWVFVFVPIWISAGLCGASSIGLGFLAIGACFGVCLGQVLSCMVVGATWIFYVTSSNSVLVLYCFSQLSEYLSGSDSSFTLSLVCLTTNFAVVGITTRLARQPLKDQVGPAFERHLPKVLYRVSDFFYTANQPAKPPAKCNSFNGVSLDIDIDARLHQSLEYPPRSRESMQSPDCGFSQCLACCDRPGNAVLMPCGHSGLCEDCASATGSVCPVCRSQVTYTLTLKRQNHSIAQVQSPVKREDSSF